MKKNLTVKVAALLMALTMITACFVGSTFAKYVTSAEGNAQARVAKWGIVMEAESDAIFLSEYSSDYGISVKSDDDALVVAPGTKGGSVSVTISGTPEVAFELALDLGETEDIVLPAGTYTDYTRFYMNDAGEWGYHDTFTLDADYHPIQYTLAIDIPDIGTKTKVGTLPEIIAALNNFADTDDLTMQFDPLTSVEGTITLSWEWPFEQGHDDADTFLGNIAAGVCTADGAVTELKVNMTASATQID